MDHLDELRAATASSLPPNGLAPRTYARDHATFEALSNQRGLIADWLVDRLSSSRTAPLSVLTVGCGGGALDAASRRLGAFAWRVFLLVCAGQANCGRRPWLSVRCGRLDARGHGHIADTVGAANAER
jgi:hypothetical protein